MLWWVRIGALLVAVDTLVKGVRNYTRKRIRKKARELIIRNMRATLVQCGLLVLAAALLHYRPGVVTSWCGMLLGWVLLLWNVRRLVFETVPALLDLRRRMRGLHGTILELLGISLLAEIVGGASVWLILLLTSAMLTRTWLFGWLDMLSPLRALWE